METVGKGWIIFHGYIPLPEVYIKPQILSIMENE